MGSGDDVSQLRQDHVADTEQFASWAKNYQELLEKRGLLDEQLLMAGLLSTPNIQHPYRKLHLASYDLLTAAQQQYLSRSLQQRKSVYGFSLGQPLLDLPAIDAAISVMALLKNRTNTVEFGFLLRNQFFGLIFSID